VKNDKAHMQSKAEQLAKEAAFFSDFIQKLPAYCSESPDPELVIWQNNQLVMTETPRGRGGAAYLNQLRDGHPTWDAPSFLPDASELSQDMRYEINAPVLNQDSGEGFRFRRRFTLAHEIGHFCLKKHEAEILEWIDSPKFEHNEIEYMCDRFASIFLIPHTVLTSMVHSIKNEHPYKGIQLLCDKFHVNVETMVRRLAFTGVLRDSDWFIGFFRYSLNPAKRREGYKWRLWPDCLCLPRGLSVASHGACGSTEVYTGHSYYHTGLDTLRLCYPGWSIFSDWRKLYWKFKSTEEDNSEEFPWKDLNTLSGDSRNRRNLIHLRPLVLNRGEGVPFPDCIFSKAEELSEVKAKRCKPWHDKFWKLSATDIRIQGSRNPKTSNQMVVTARLMLQKRENVL
jgi:hypothetical protein